MGSDIFSSRRVDGCLAYMYIAKAILGISLIWDLFSLILEFVKLKSIWRTTEEVRLGGDSTRRYLGGSERVVWKHWELTLPLHQATIARLSNA